MGTPATTAQPTPPTSGSTPPAKTEPSKAAAAAKTATPVKATPTPANTVTAPPPTVPTSPLLHPQTIVMIAGGIALLVAVGFISFSVGKGQTKQVAVAPSPTTKPSPSATPTLSPTPSPTPGDPTEKWNTYTNKALGLTMKFPTSYLASTGLTYDLLYTTSEKDKQALDTCLKKPNTDCNLYALGIQFEKKPKGTAKNLTEFIQQVVKDDIKSYTPATISGLPAFEKKFDGIGVLDHLYIDHGTTVIHIYANAIKDAEANMTTYKLMTGTLKFAN